MKKLINSNVQNLNDGESVTLVQCLEHNVAEKLYVVIKVIIVLVI